MYFKNVIFSPKFLFFFACFLVELQSKMITKKKNIEKTKVSLFYLALFGSRF